MGPSVGTGMGRLLIVLALVAAACGGASTAATTSTTAALGVGSGTVAPAGDESPQVEPSETVDAGGGTTPSETPSQTQEERTRPEGDDAPDFVLALGQGGEFSLSAEQKPVYLIFWADW